MYVCMLMYVPGEFYVVIKLGAENHDQQLAAKVVETLSVTRAISDETLNYQHFLPSPSPSQYCWLPEPCPKAWFTTLNGGRGWRGKFMAVLSVKELFFRRE